jgi:hypothetical protein
LRACGCEPDHPPTGVSLRRNPLVAQARSSTLLDPAPPALAGTQQRGLIAVENINQY